MEIGCSYNLGHTELWLVRSLPLDLNLPIPENALTALHTAARIQKPVSLAASALAPASYRKGTGLVSPCLPSSQSTCLRNCARARRHTHT